MRAFNADVKVKGLTGKSIDENHEKCRRAFLRVSAPVTDGLAAALGTEVEQITAWLDDGKLRKADFTPPREKLLCKVVVDGEAHEIKDAEIILARLVIGRKEEDEPRVGLVIQFDWTMQDIHVLWPCLGESVPLFVEPVQAELKLAGAA